MSLWIIIRASVAGPTAAYAFLSPDDENSNKMIIISFFSVLLLGHSCHAALCFYFPVLFFSSNSIVTPSAWSDVNRIRTTNTINAAECSLNFHYEMSVSLSIHLICETENVMNEYIHLYSVHLLNVKINETETIMQFNKWLIEKGRTKANSTATFQNGNHTSHLSHLSLYPIDHWISSF